MSWAFTRIWSPIDWMLPWSRLSARWSAKSREVQKFDDYPSRRVSPWPPLVLTNGTRRLATAREAPIRPTSRGRGARVLLPLVPGKSWRGHPRPQAYAFTWGGLASLFPPRVHAYVARQKTAATYPLPDRFHSARFGSRLGALHSSVRPAASARLALRRMVRQESHCRTEDQADSKGC